MKVLVVGAGAVGGWLGGHLARGGEAVTLVARGPRAAALAREGLTLRLADASLVFPTPVAGSVAEACAGSRFDWALVCVKSYHSTDVAAELASVDGVRRVACFQNGIGNEDQLVRQLPEVPVVPATLTTGVWLAELTTVAGSAKGGAGLAADAAADDLAQALVRGGISVQRYPDAAAMKWSKLLLNLLGSATSALLDWPPARVFTDRRLFHVERAAWLEAAAVMRGLGHRPVALPGYPVDWFDRAVNWLPERWLYQVAAGRLAGGRGERRTGLAMDLQAGRTDSEVSVLHGAVAAAGAELGTATPTCAALARLVTDVTAGRLPRAALVDRPAALLAAIAGTGLDD
jgi:2-dehydropantoate 2-reductase